LQDIDFALLGGIPDVGRLGLACQLAFWRSQGWFPDEEADIARAVIAHLARQIDVPVDTIESYAFRGRSSRLHRQLIPDYLAVGDFDEAAEGRFRTWLLTDILPREPSPAAVEAEIASWFGAARVARIGKSEEEGVIAGTADFSDQGRARVDRTNRGALTLYAAAPDGRLIGADLCTPASEHLAHMLAWAVQQGQTASQLLEMSSYHPTIEEGLKQALRTICGATPLTLPENQDPGVPSGG